MAKPPPGPDHYRVTEAGCWEWLGSHDGKGYGLCNPAAWGVADGFNVGGYLTGKNNAPRAQAHRASYALHVGPIPDGAFLLHSCDNPPCINPAHLRPGSNTDNMRDMSSRGRGKGKAKSERCSNGHDLTDPANLYVSGKWWKCKPCAKESRRRYYLQHREHILSNMREKYAQAK